ncbi:UPF0187-domain-containing protein [Linderina pennispora]|uniref:UPF0187-domain-containing protein n=1 Tax=Linderina pennispora TaxID=61395 RepID=A0A1Y1WFF9_9FUNG|nr:UPF0187-domain-containing protein [Linderina pennispora]ORX72227.1 UPF0187-domain-containing protein [Linderina pennispora]
MIIDTANPSNVVSGFGFEWPDALRLRGSVIRISFIYVAAMTGYGVGIAFLIQHHKDLAINMSVMSFVSLVLSLLLVFRTNSAYDRYWEGRKIWQDLKVTSRNLIRNLWCGVLENSIEDSVQKRQALKSVAAFVISVKHYLRGEDGVDYADYDGLLSPEFRLLLATNNNAYNYGAIGAGNNSPMGGSRTGLAATSATFHAQRLTEGWERQGEVPLPSLLLFEMQKFGEYIMDNKLCHVPFYASMLATINTLSASLGGCERILSTPIPLAYRIHLTHTLYLYLLVLPWSLGSMGSLWKTIVLQFIISFMLIGIDSISREIQNPFGYDANDLPLDAYCDNILLELNSALSHNSPKALVSNEDTLSNHNVATGGGAAGDDKSANGGDSTE